jgi:hypothetical protein
MAGSVQWTIAGGYVQEVAGAGRADNQATGIAVWAIALTIIVLVTGFTVITATRRRRVYQSRILDLRTAAGNTIALATSAITQIEHAERKMPKEVRGRFEEAIGLRDGASASLDAAISQPALVQANTDAAFAVMLLHGVLRRLNVEEAPPNPLHDPAPHRCFYCSRDDQSPYYRETIGDRKGNRLEIEICDVDRHQMQEGRQPHLATGRLGELTVPWWAVPDSPYYHAYGGPSWQYWLPFMIGMDAGHWFDAVAAGAVAPTTAGSRT